MKPSALTNPSLATKSNHHVDRRERNFLPPHVAHAAGCGLLERGCTLCCWENLASKLQPLSVAGIWFLCHTSGTLWKRGQQIRYREQHKKSRGKNAFRFLSGGSWDSLSSLKHPPPSRIPSLWDFHLYNRLTLVLAHGTPVDSTPRTAPQADFRPPPPLHSHPLLEGSKVIYQSIRGQEPVKSLRKFFSQENLRCLGIQNQQLQFSGNLENIWGRKKKLQSFYLLQCFWNAESK